VALAWIFRRLRKETHTLTAQPIQSKPGPRLAIVAGAKAMELSHNGCSGFDGMQYAFLKPLEEALVFLPHSLFTFMQRVCNE
jgi:hypothetical protein